MGIHLISNIFNLLYQFQDEVILLTILAIFLACIVLTVQTGFIQLRGFLYMLSLLKKALFNKARVDVDEVHILPIQSLFTAMSTSIGIGNIVGPIIAIKLGGPSAVIGFVLAMLFGAASTFTEVYLALVSREETDEYVHGGPMQYLKKYIGSFWGHLYAVTAFILLICWCSSQSNTFGDLLNTYNIPDYISGAILAILVLFILLGGIKRIAEFASQVVPWMFIFYSVSCLLIIAMNYTEIFPSIKLIFQSLFSSAELLKTGGGFSAAILAFRWGLAKGFQTNESGLGTASIPHSMAGGTRPFDQAILAMAAVFSNGILCLLTSMVVLVTGAWKYEHLGIGINILRSVFEDHLSWVGSFLLILCSILFVITTVLGNAYNGSQAFGFVTKDRYLKLYYLFVGLFVFLGTIMDAKVAWSYVDYFLIPLAIPHVIGLVLIVRKNKQLHQQLRDL